MCKVSSETIAGYSEILVCKLIPALYVSVAFLLLMAMISTHSNIRLSLCSLIFVDWTIHAAIVRSNLKSIRIEGIMSSTIFFAGSTKIKLKIIEGVIAENHHIYMVSDYHCNIFFRIFSVVIVS